MCPSSRSTRERPGPSFGRALFFPIDEKSPSYIWVGFKIERTANDRDLGKYQLTDLSNLFGAASTSCNVSLRHIIGYYFRDSEARFDLISSQAGGLNNDEAPMNESVAAVIQWGQLQHCWRGPIVVMKEKDEASDGATDEQYISAISEMWLISSRLSGSVGRMRTMAPAPFGGRPLRRNCNSPDKDRCNA